MVLVHRQAVNRWNRIVDPEMNPQTYGHLVFDKRTKTIQWIKDSIFNKWCWINWMSACRKMEIDPLNKAQVQVHQGAPHNIRNCKFFFGYLETLSLYSHVCPGTHSVEHTGLEFRNSPTRVL